jgi:ubiquinone/menaquinone biosynthesis C-methylase UbiE
MSSFDQKAATWDENPERVERADAFANIIRKEIDLSKVEMALEYGSGTGLLSFSLGNELKDITLMDESREMTRVTNNKCEELDIRHFHPVRYDLLTDELPEHKFDLIYSVMTMHHVDDTDAILKKFNEVLTPNGHLVLIDLVTEDGSFHNFEFDGHLGFDVGYLKNKIMANGFEYVSYQIAYTITAERAGESREYPLFLVIAKKK